MSSSPGFGLLLRVPQPVMTQNPACSAASDGGGLVGDRRRRMVGLVLAVRPAIVATTRRLAGRAICHPVGLGAAVAARLLGWSTGRCLAMALVADRTVPALAARSSAPPVRFLLVWSHACSFRRRWPGNLVRAGNTLSRRVSLDGAGARIDALGPAAGADQPGRRPDRRPPFPDLSRLPRRIDGTTVAWSIDLDPNEDPADLASRAGGLPLVDPRILNVGVEPGPDPSTGWLLVVDFDVEPPTWGLAVLDRPGAMVSIDLTSSGHDRQEEGGSHGNG